jgi:hypothetical protein
VPLFTGKFREACRGHGCIVFEELFLIALQFLQALLARSQGIHLPPEGSSSFFKPR